MNINISIGKLKNRVTFGIDGWYAHYHVQPNQSMNNISIINSIDFKRIIPMIWNIIMRISTFKVLKQDNSSRLAIETVENYKLITSGHKVPNLNKHIRQLVEEKISYLQSGDITKITWPKNEIFWNKSYQSYIIQVIIYSNEICVRIDTDCIYWFKLKDVLNQLDEIVVFLYILKSQYSRPLYIKSYLHSTDQAFNKEIREYLEPLLTHIRNE